MRNKVSQCTFGPLVAVNPCREQTFTAAFRFMIIKRAPQGIFAKEPLITQKHFLDIFRRAKYFICLKMHHYHGHSFDGLLVKRWKSSATIVPAVIAYRA